MPARKNLSHAAKTREKIQVSMLINRLTDHILGKVDLDASQVQSIKILLGKALPDLKATEHSGQIANMTHEQWLETLKDE